MAPTLVDPIPPPPLDIPPSNATIKVSIIDSTSYIKLPMDFFFHPHYKGVDDWSGPAFCFLVEHEPSQRKVLFDLGVRKDWENIAPVIVKKIKEWNWTIEVEKNVSEILTSHGVDVAGGAIDAVIWSHHHFDHIGDVAGTLPRSTELVVGPGFKEAFLPGFPENPKGVVPSADFEDREVRQLDFSAERLKFGRFRAHDFFGDGSFYLLDAPGHSKGHMCGLARTTASSAAPSSGGQDGATFILMGADSCHYGGEFRPTKHLPLPSSLEPSPVPRLHRHACPGALLRDVHRNARADEPFFLVNDSFPEDPRLANDTIGGLGEFDAHDNVLVLIAHDASCLGQLKFYPESINDWHADGVAEKVRWRFLADLKDAVEASATQNRADHKAAAL